ncbi:hypothetical protein [Streptomyces sp. NRRL B-24484]|uniref:hypothetical protein n=1 Tax=Streptomyces sp. NRRL B-24484 TaxID=1463833 RepID=UPI0004C0C168|nr:hypothetical protein [Streptomyces sp. NRRL B-24484]
MYEDYDPSEHDFDYEPEWPSREEEKAAEIALDLADEACWATEDATNPQPSHTELCEGCHGSGTGCEHEIWDDETGTIVTIDHDRCPECGGCGYYNCDNACEFAQDPDVH